MAVLGDHDQVLDPDPELARDVDAGLDRDHVAGLEHVLGGLAQPRRLVDLEPDPVAETVAEVVLVAAVADHRPGGLVGLLAADPGADRLEPGRLGGADELVGLARRLADLADGEGPGAVGAVAVDQRAHVPDDQVARADLAVGGLGVRERAVGARGDDRRERGLGAELADPRVRRRRRPRARCARRGRRRAPSRRRRRRSGRPRRSPPARPRPCAGAGARPGRRRRTSSTPSPSSSSSLARLATLVAASSKPTRPESREASSGSSRPPAITRSKASPTSLRGALGVAEVGDEGRDLRADHDQRAGAGEAGEPARVGGRVAARVARAARGRRRSAGRGPPRRPAPRAASARSALTRPSLSAQHLERLAVAVGALARRSSPSTRPSSTEWRRHSSRAETSERWTSTAGSPAISSASRIA